MYELFARESASDLLSESSELLVVSLELFVDSLSVELHGLVGVVAEVVNACEGSGESLGGGLNRKSYSRPQRILFTCISLAKEQRSLISHPRSSSSDARSAASSAAA